MLALDRRDVHRAGRHVGAHRVRADRNARTLRGTRIGTLFDMPAKHKAKPTRYWSKAVTERSNALDLEPDVFRGNARAIAASLKRSADRSKRRKSSPFRSAMSMLTFFENRAGSNLTPSRRRTLHAAKRELRRLYHRSA